ncbi:DUF5615 family PIN-like protein [Bernardetia sp. OM2101]|uniref:DUF5615 family PIN-like protein n=1 Tax=Bernardetia sp. OM2101 TaxID=3344876 RepID=UPI0035D0BD61
MIKIVCDVHISFKVVRFLESKNVEAVHVNDILDGDTTKDNKIAEFVDENNYTLMSKDADFQNSHFLNKSPKKLIKINLGNISTKMLIDILDANFDFIYTHLSEDSFLIEIDNDMIRIRE